ncbi:TIR domain-containing protein [Sinorhizobium fredii]|uniref:TIR domain-containing protein n=1 Tax=Rhizobium fredii TaxID=380 RepID=UPI0030973DEA
MGALFDSYFKSLEMTGIMSLAPVKRKAFFSFHYDDIMRVNNVRQAFKLYNPGTVLGGPTFYDSSLWESRKLEGDEALKRLIREGVEYTSVVCVLVGTNTWWRRWVKYEIARSIVDERGLLAVHINGINHHQRRVPDARGVNPLTRMAVGKMSDGTYRIFERTSFGWERYSDYSSAVKLPKYLHEPAVGHVTPLNWNTMEYDFAAQNGSKNIGGWLDLAAKMAGR